MVFLHAFVVIALYLLSYYYYKYTDFKASFVICFVVSTLNAYLIVFQQGLYERL